MSPLNSAVDNRINIQNVQPTVAVQIAFVQRSRAFVAAPHQFQVFLFQQRRNQVGIMNRSVQFVEKRVKPYVVFCAFGNNLGVLVKNQLSDCMDFPIGQGENSFWLKYLAQSIEHKETGQEGFSENPLCACVRTRKLLFFSHLSSAIVPTANRAWKNSCCLLQGWLQQDFNRRS